MAPTPCFESSYTPSPAYSINIQRVFIFKCFLFIVIMMNKKLNHRCTFLNERFLDCSHVCYFQIGGTVVIQGWGQASESFLTTISKNYNNIFNHCISSLNENTDQQKLHERYPKNSGVTECHLTFTDFPRNSLGSAKQLAKLENLDFTSPSFSPPGFHLPLMGHSEWIIWILCYMAILLLDNKDEIGDQPLKLMFLTMATTSIPCATKFSQ